MVRERPRDAEAAESHGKARGRPVRGGAVAAPDDAAVPAPAGALVVAAACAAAGNLGAQGVGVQGGAAAGLFGGHAPQLTRAVAAVRAGGRLVDEDLMQVRHGGAAGGGVIPGAGAGEDLEGRLPGPVLSGAPTQPVTAFPTRSRASMRAQVTSIRFLPDGWVTSPTTTCPVWTARRRYRGSLSSAAANRSAASQRARSPVAARAVVSGHRQSQPSACSDCALPHAQVSSCARLPSIGSGMPSPSRSSSASSPEHPSSATPSHVRQVAGSRSASGAVPVIHRVRHPSSSRTTALLPRAAGVGLVVRGTGVDAETARRETSPTGAGQAALPGLQLPIRDRLGRFPRRPDGRASFRAAGAVVAAGLPAEHVVAGVPVAT
jgi:hypothetical protein